jgi:hypothetical protein
MRAVWSFWSKPYLAEKNFSWRTELHHRLSWILSVESARPHFASTALVTDDAGADLLVNTLGLRFDNLSTSLKDLADDDPDWWTLGKLMAYSQQEEPFLHIDSDAYLFRPPPEHAMNAPIVAQHPEGTAHSLPWYDVDRAELAIRLHGNRTIPEPWSWYRTFSSTQDAACCGIVGGQNTDFFRRYGETVLGILRAPANRHAFDEWPDKRVLNPMFEQYLLAACAAHDNLPITYLFESHEHAANGGATLMGFTHLMGGAKSDDDLTRRLELRVAREYPDFYERALDSVVKAEAEEADEAEVSAKGKEEAYATTG